MLQWEIRKLLRTPWLGGCLGIVVVSWSIILYFAAQTDSARYLDKLQSFWSVIGSLTLGLVILAFLMKLFVLDEEHRVKEVVQTTKFGKRTIFHVRLASVLLFTSGLVLTFTLVQLSLFFVFNSFNYAMDDILNGAFFQSLLFVWLGSMGLALFGAFFSTITKSQAATIIIVGILFGLTYPLRGDMLAVFSFLWFLEKGFFSYLMRANREVLTDANLLPVFVWYISLLLSMAGLTIMIRKRRHER